MTNDTTSPTDATVETGGEQEWLSEDEATAAISVGIHSLLRAHNVTVRILRCGSKLMIAAHAEDETDIPNDLVTVPVAGHA